MKARRIVVDNLSTESDPSLQLVWVDRMTLSVRSDIPVATIRFYSVTPENLVEACRLQTTVKHLHEIVDVICRNTDYYPEKPDT